MPRGPLWESLAPRFPLDLWLLQGESQGEAFELLWSQPVVLFSLYPDPSAPAPPDSLVLALTLYPSVLLAESLSGGQGFGEFAGSRSRSLMRSGSRSRSLPPPIASALTRADEGLWRLGNEDQRRAENALQGLGYRWAALDWLAEQADDPDLARRRGLRPGEPLPHAFGLFEPDGRLRDTLPRSGLIQLRHWLRDDDAILAWTFPDGLSEAEDKHLRSELHTLHHYQRPDGGHGQPWSPLAAIEAVLSDWPEDQPTRDVRLATAEQDLMAVLDALFPEPPDPQPA